MAKQTKKKHSSGSRSRYPQSMLYDFGIQLPEMGTDSISVSYSDGRNALVQRDTLARAYYGKLYDKLTDGQKAELSRVSMGHISDNSSYVDSLNREGLTSGAMKGLLTYNRVQEYNDKVREHTGETQRYSGKQIPISGKRITWPKAIDTDIARFMSSYSNEKSLIDEVNAKAAQYGIDPYELLVAANFEGNSYAKDNPGGTDANTYFNTHNVTDILFNHKYPLMLYKPKLSENDFNSDITDILKNVGIWNGKNADYVYGNLDKYFDKYESGLDIMPYVGDMNNVERLAAIRAKTGTYNSMNPKQKGWTNPATGKTVNNTYSDMVSSQAGKLRELYPNLFSPDFDGWEDYGSGGKIHIKPENRGKFTALKERTGHSASWFKENGTPAQKKMATFALNARKWKHADGGPIDYSSISTKDVVEKLISRFGSSEKALEAIKNFRGLR